MAQLNESLEIDKSWIQDLVQGELFPGVDRGPDPARTIEEAAVKFLTDVRRGIEEYVHTFNLLSEKGQRYSEIKIYNVAQSAADFMIFRNQIKLIFTISAHGTIAIAYSVHAGQLLGGMARPEGEALPGICEIKAELGPFNQVFWKFQGFETNAAQTAKYFLGDFVRTTRAQAAGQSSNQALLNQIKSLLQSKGLQL